MHRIGRGIFAAVYLDVVNIADEHDANCKISAGDGTSAFDAAFICIYFYQYELLSLIHI